MPATTSAPTVMQATRTMIRHRSHLVSMHDGYGEHTVSDLGYQALLDRHASEHASGRYAHTHTSARDGVLIV